VEGNSRLITDKLRSLKGNNNDKKWRVLDNLAHINARRKFFITYGRRKHHAISNLMNLRIILLQMKPILSLVELWGNKLVCDVNSVIWEK